MGKGWATTPGNQVSPSGEGLRAATFLLHPQRDSNPCRHLESMIHRVQPVLSGRLQFPVCAGRRSPAQRVVLADIGPFRAKEWQNIGSIQQLPVTTFAIYNISQPILHSHAEGSTMALGNHCCRPSANRQRSDHEAGRADRDNGTAFQIVATVGRFWTSNWARNSGASSETPQR